MLPIPAVRQAAMRVQQVLDGRRRVVLTDQHLGVVGLDDGDVLVLHLLQRAVEAGDLRPAVGAALPGVAGPELELGDLGLALHRVEGGEQGRDVDAVAAGALGAGAHLDSSCGLAGRFSRLPHVLQRAFPRPSPIRPARPGPGKVGQTESTSPLVGTPVPAVTSTCSTASTWLTEVPRTWRTPSAMPFMPWM